MDLMNESYLFAKYDMGAILLQRREMIKKRIGTLEGTDFRKPIPELAHEIASDAKF
jgi:hypothetical protein